MREKITTFNPAGNSTTDVSASIDRLTQLHSRLPDYAGDAILDIVLEFDVIHGKEIAAVLKELAVVREKNKKAERELIVLTSALENACEQLEYYAELCRKT